MSNQKPSPGQVEGRTPLRLARGKVTANKAARKRWKLLVVDDEQEVHDVTRLALEGFECHGRGLELLHAYSGRQAREMHTEHGDIAVILLDVVMESDQAGLDVVRFIREELHNPFVRIILRTGQPGQAPEHKVITDYDINDYKHKTELTRQKLFTTVYTSISSYRDLMALEANRRGLEQVIEASAEVFALEGFSNFAEGVLEQLTALLYLDQDALVLQASALAAKQGTDNTCKIIAATGRYQELRGDTIESCVDAEAMARIRRARHDQCDIFEENYYVSYHRDDEAMEHVLYVTGELPISLSDRHLIGLFTRNVSIACRNRRLLAEARGEAGER